MHTLLDQLLFHVNVHTYIHFTPDIINMGRTKSSRKNLHWLLCFKFFYLSSETNIGKISASINSITWRVSGITSKFHNITIFIILNKNMQANKNVYLWSCSIILPNLTTYLQCLSINTIKLKNKYRFHTWFIVTLN
jgi:hypothetical protein